MYKTPAVRPPSLSELEIISRDLGLNISQDDLKQYQDVMSDTCKIYDAVDTRADPGLPVAYPRLAGQRPPPEENPYNAWWIKCDIQGEKTGLLCGRNVVIKDNIPIAGLPLMCGSKLLEGYTPDIDATVVHRILSQGGRIIGKSTCEDLCFSGSSFNSLKGQVTNPHDTTRVAGGSSSGSAVLVATGETELALGTDQAGSIRIPCSWTGTVGYKPTYGLVPYTGILSIDYSLDHIGPITKSVRDCALLLQAIAGPDIGMDSRQPEHYDIPDYVAKLKEDPSGLTIGLLEEGFACCDPEVAGLVQKVAKQLQDFGMKMQDVSNPDHDFAFKVWLAVDIQGAYETMIKGEGFGVGYKGYYPSSMIQAISKAYKTQQNDLSVVLKYISMLGEYLKRTYGLKHYAHAQNVSRDIIASYDKLLESCDVLVMPTTPFTAPKIPDENISVKEYLGQTLHMAGNTAPFNLTGHPSITLNAGYIRGLPVGVMVVGKMFDDVTVLKVANAIEKIVEKSKEDKGNSLISSKTG